MEEGHSASGVVEEGVARARLGRSLAESRSRKENDQSGRKLKHDDVRAKDKRWITREHARE